MEEVAGQMDGETTLTFKPPQIQLLLQLCNAARNDKDIGQLCQDVAAGLQQSPPYAELETHAQALDFASGLEEYKKQLGSKQAEDAAQEVLDDIKDAAKLSGAGGGRIIITQGP